MAEHDEEKICLEFADFPGADMPWLIEKSKAIEAAIEERLHGAFTWCSVVAHPEIDGFRVFFQLDRDGGEIHRKVPETLVDIIREKAGDDLPRVRDSR